MKKKLGLAMIAVFLLALGVLSYQFLKIYNEKEGKRIKIATLPEFVLADLNGKRFAKENMPSNKTKVLLFFNSECHYCQEEAAQLFELKGSIPDAIDFYWISSELPERIREFGRQYQLDKIKNCTLLFDENAKAGTSFAISSTPQFLVYGPNNTLLKNHKGAWRIVKLLENLKNGFKTP